MGICVTRPGNKGAGVTSDDLGNKGAGVTSDDLESFADVDRRNIGTWNPTQEELTYLWNLFDKDNSGYLDQSECTELLQASCGEVIERMQDDLERHKDCVKTTDLSAEGVKLLRSVLESGIRTLTSYKESLSSPEIQVRIPVSLSLRRSLVRRDSDGPLA